MFYHNVGEPLRFAFLMIDDMSMMSLASATEPLRSAYRLLGREAFRWDLCSLDGAPVIASNGMPFQLPTITGLDAPSPSTNRPGAAWAKALADIAISAGPRV